MDIFFNFEGDKNVHVHVNVKGYILLRTVFFFQYIDQCRKKSASSIADHVHDGGKELRRKGRNASFAY